MVKYLGKWVRQKRHIYTTNQTFKHKTFDCHCSYYKLHQFLFKSSCFTTKRPCKHSKSRAPNNTKPLKQESLTLTIALTTNNFHFAQFVIQNIESFRPKVRRKTF